MSNTRVYGFCDAGCRRRVPTYEEYQSIAASLKCTPDESGNYILELGKRYRIKRGETCQVVVSITWWDVSDDPTSEMTRDVVLNLPEYEANFDSSGSMELQIASFGFIAVSTNEYIYKINYIVDKERITQEEFTIERGFTVISKTITLSGAKECYLLNDTGEISVSVADSVPNATEETDGLMSATDKAKLDSMYPIRIEDGQGNAISKLILEEIESEDGLILNIKTS